MPVIILFVLAVLLLPWICLIVGGVLAVFFGEASLNFFVFDFFLGICRWLVTFLEPYPDNFAVLLIGFFWAVFGGLLAIVVGQHRPDVV